MLAKGALQRAFEWIALAAVEELGNLSFRCYCLLRGVLSRNIRQERPLLRRVKVRVVDFEAWGSLESTGHSFDYLLSKLKSYFARLVGAGGKCCTATRV